MQEQNLNRVSQTLAALPLAIAALSVLALPGWADGISLAPATISTSLDQCGSQTGGPCVNAPLAHYTGNLSGFSTETVGAGAFVSANGFGSPILTANVPTNSANADISGDLQYLIEVSGASGPVSLGVNSIGSISVNTSGTSPGDPTNDASLFSLV